MQESYYSIEVMRSPVREFGQAFFRLKYRREWITERELWRDTLVSQERISKDGLE
jgi:hypothetical protein